MKKNIYNLLTITFLFFILICLIIFSRDTMDSVLLAMNIWKENVFPSLFPFFVITDLLINYGFIDLLGGLTKKIMNKLFYLPGDASFIIIASMLSGFPSSAKYIKEMLEEKKIDTDEAQYLLSFTHFSNPLFVIGFIGGTALKSKELGYIVLLCHIISNFLIAFAIRKKRKINISPNKFSNTLEEIAKKRQSTRFIPTLTSSILKTINTLILLLGIITTFLIITSLITNLIPIDNFSKTIISGLLEMTQGIKYLSILDGIPLNLKTSIMTMFISFGGISIHLQVMSILSDTKINYKEYLLSRIAHATLSSSLTLLLTTYLL